MIKLKEISTYFIIFGLIVIGLFLIKIFDISYPLTIISTSKSTELAVVGEGKVEVVPDTAYIDAGVAVNNVSSVDEVQKTINIVNNDIIAAMKKLGIEKKDIKTSNYSIYPNYSYENNANKISGYNGNATITIKVNDPSTAAKVLSEAVASGANKIQGTRFVVDKPEKYREEVRDKAIENARSQAEKLAKSLGIRLGKVTNIVESSPGTVIPLSYKAVSAMGLGGGGGEPNIEPGSQTITSTVTLYFEKK